MSNSSMNLAMVISELDIGGAEKNFTQLALGLKQRGHQVQVYSLDPAAADPQQHRFIEQLRQADVPVHFLANKRGRQIWANVKALKPLLAAQAPDVIQAFLFRANLVARLAAGSIPISLGIRQAEPRLWVRLLEKWAIRQSDATVFVSNDCALHYVKSSNLESHQNFLTSKPALVVIPNSIPATDFHCRPDLALRQAFWKQKLNLDVADDAWIYLFVGRLTEQKRVCELLPLVIRQLECQPDDHLVIVGDGPLKAQIQSLRNGCSVSDRIHLVGWQSNPLAWMNHSNLLLLISAWEGMPNVILEAMANSLPFLCTMFQGLHDIFYPNGPAESAMPLEEIQRLQQQRPVLEFNQVQPDLTALEQALQRLRQQPEIHQQLVDLNLQWAQTFFSVDSMVAPYEQLFRKLAAK